MSFSACSFGISVRLKQAKLALSRLRRGFGGLVVETTKSIPFDSSPLSSEVPVRDKHTLPPTNVCGSGKCIAIPEIICRISRCGGVSFPLFRGGLRRCCLPPFPGGDLRGGSVVPIPLEKGATLGLFCNRSARVGEGGVIPLLKGAPSSGGVVNILPNQNSVLPLLRR